MHLTSEIVATQKMALLDSEDMLEPVRLVTLPPLPALARSLPFWLDRYLVWLAYKLAPPVGSDLHDPCLAPWGQGTGNQ